MSNDIAIKSTSFRECRRLLDSNTKYKALGGIVACPVASITEICNRVKYIKDVRDVSSVPCIPHFFAESFFNYICSCFVLHYFLM